MALFADLFSTIEGQASSIAGQFSSIMGMVSPALQAVFIVYVMFVIWSYWSNESSFHGTVIDLVKRIAAWGLILGMGVNIGGYTSIVMPMVSEIGKDLSSAYGGETGDASSLDEIVKKLMDITNSILQAAEESAEEDTSIATTGEVPVSAPEASGGVFGVLGDAAEAVSDAIDGITSGAMEAIFGGFEKKLFAWASVILLWVVGAIFLAIAAAYMLSAQVLLNILAGVGPIFFAFALFPATRGFFTNWVGSVLNYGFFFLFATITVNLGVDYLANQLDIFAGEIISAGSAVEAHNTSANWSALFPILIMFFVFSAVMLQLPSLASSLFGGLAAGGFGTVFSSARTGGRMISSTGRATSKGAAMGYQGGKQGVQWLANKLGLGGGTIKPERDGN